MSNTLFKSLIITSMAFCGSANAADCSDVSKVIAKKLQDAYVIEATATKLSQLLNSQPFLTRCSKQKSAEHIADFMTTELNKIANDKHLSVVYDPHTNGVKPCFLQLRENEKGKHAKSKA